MHMPPSGSVEPVELVRAVSLFSNVTDFMKEKYSMNQPSSRNPFLIDIKTTLPQFRSLDEMPVFDEVVFSRKFPPDAWWAYSEGHA
jgi:hypothetical protein